MSFKEWNAVVTLVSVVVIGFWVAQGALASGDWAGPVQPAAWRVLWGTIWSIVFNIVAIIVVTILVTIATRTELQDEKADERDKIIGAKSMSVAYFVLSIGGAAILIGLATGLTPTLATYALFGALMLSGAATELARLVYYRIG